MAALATGTLEVSAKEFYRRAPRILQEAGVPFLLGGAYAFTHYTGIARHTKDLDLFLRQDDLTCARAALEASGYRTELTYEHWLAKVFANGHFIDLIFNLGNGLSAVDDSWFKTAEDCRLFGQPMKVLGPEEMVWSKLFVLDRGRYDGADVAHILRASGDRLDWQRLLDRCGRHGRVLLSHLVLFGYVYPAERDHIPDWVLRELTNRMLNESHTGDGALCQGTLLSPTQYQVDVERWGYRDARLPPYGDLTPDQVENWVEGVQAGK